MGLLRSLVSAAALLAGLLVATGHCGKLNITVPAIMFRLYRHNALDGCAHRPVLSILANGSESLEGGGAAYDFDVTYEESERPEAAHLSLELPRGCHRLPRHQRVLQVRAAVWNSSVSVLFQRRSAAYIARLPHVVLKNETTLRIFVRNSTTSQLSCPLSSARASLIINYPECPPNGQSSRPRRSPQRGSKGRRRHYVPDAASELRKASRRWQSRTCSLKPLYVDFQQIGWDWVIAPNGYFAQQCKGGCTFPMGDQNVTGHSIVRKVLHTVAIDVPPVCCVPINLRPLSMLYIDDRGHIVLRKVPNMIATACGCR